MGRPKKRRREGEADEAANPQPNASDSTISVNDQSAFGNFGIITPPQFHDSNCFVNDVANTNGGASHQHLNSSDAFGISPISNIELVLSPHTYRRYAYCL
jgi:hypothetical protein